MAANRGCRSLHPLIAIPIIVMAQPLSTPHQMPAGAEPARKHLPVPALAAGAVGAIALLGALLLWFHYGTAVFFETIAAGISACF